MQMQTLDIAKDEHLIVQLLAFMVSFSIQVLLMLVLIWKQMLADEEEARSVFIDVERLQAV